MKRHDFLGNRLLPVMLIIIIIIIILMMSFPPKKDQRRLTMKDPSTVQFKITQPKLDRSAWIQIPQDAPFKLLENGTLAKTPRKINPIEYIHITKTGGTMLESLAYQHGILWARCHYWIGNGCGSYPDRKSEAFVQRTTVQHIKGLPLQMVRWHTPPHWLEPNWMENLTTFTVVRNPYNRWISEYYCDYYGYKKNDEADNADIMNEWIQANITMAQVQSDHTLPQHYYVYESGNKVVVTHVLKYETLATEFPKLMKQYGLEMLKLPTKQRDRDSRLTKRNLTKKTIRLINLQAENDFERFGYRMVRSAEDFV